VRTYLTCANRQLIARDPEYSAVLLEVLTEGGVPVSSPGDFGKWFEDSLHRTGWTDGRLIGRARLAAEDQILTTAALRLVARRAWSKAAGSVTALDSMLVGSIGRGESGSMSDFDFLFVGDTAADLSPNGMQPSDKENTRTDVMRARPWRDEFVGAARAAMYDFPKDAQKPDLKVICAAELWANPEVLVIEQRIRHGTNALACGHNLRDAAGAIDKLLAFGARQDRSEQARHRIRLMRHYLSNPADISRPHNAHGFLSQMWQAIVFFCNVSVRPRTPYWQVPTLVVFDQKGQRSWANAVNALRLMRQCDGPPPRTEEAMIVEGARDLLRCARASFGLADGAAQEISAVLDEADAY
jgi:hypothetical protein